MSAMERIVHPTPDTPRSEQVSATVRRAAPVPEIGPEIGDE
jgi:hypothetical protein